MEIEKGRGGGGEYTSAMFLKFSADFAPMSVVLKMAALLYLDQVLHKYSEGRA